MELLVWATLAVFSELALVRMFSTIAGATTYYANLLLLASAFGLACGFSARRLARFVGWVPFLLLANLLLALGLGRLNLIENVTGEFFWSSVANKYPRPANFDLQLAVVLIALVASPLMALLGSIQGRVFVEQEWGKGGYLLCGLGGLLGALTFSLQNQLAPSLTVLLALWTGLMGVALLTTQRATVARLVSLVPLVTVLALGGVYSSGHEWSPYQRVSTVPMPWGVDLLTNGFYISTVASVPPERIPDEARQVTPLAFKSLRPDDHVLILGSGGGTADVREALHAGARRLSAVEIDPVFIKLGLAIDPERAYADSRVTVANADGRRFLAGTDERFDFIYYPFVDSQTLASSQARFRLDSFLYTVEGLRLAWTRLKPDGVLFVNFCTGTPWIRYRFFKMLQAATGEDVRAFIVKARDGGWTLYAVSKGRPLASMESYFAEVTDVFTSKPSNLPIPTDDWPFLYSRDRQVPWEHVRLLSTLLLLFAALLLGVERLQGDAPVASAPPRLLSYAFFSGAAFFFIEMRTISVLTPLLGSTFLAQALVIMGVIASSLGGTAIAALPRRLSARGAWALLFVALAGSFVVRPGLGLAVSLLLLLAPVGLAGYLFYLYVAECPREAILSLQKWNIMGGAVGGLAECAVIVLGFRASLWIGVAFYAVAWLSAYTARPALATTAPAG